MNLNPFKNKVVTIALEDKPQPVDAQSTEEVTTNPDEIAQIITESALKIVGAA